MKKRPLCFLCLAFLIVEGIVLWILGGDRVKVPANSIFSVMEEGESKSAVVVQGQIYKKEYTSKNQVLYLKENSITSEKNSYYESKLIVYDASFTELAIGECIKFTGRLQCFEGARNPGNFDRKVYYAKQGIYGSAQVEDITGVSKSSKIVQNGLFELREKWKTLLYETMSEENAPVLAAMLLGVRTDLSEDSRELYQKSGISHTLAISGLHISLIGLGIYQLLRKLGMRFAVAGFASLAVLGTYVLMIGFSVSVMRAFLMLLLRIGADLAGRSYDLATALLVSAAATIMYEPLYLTDAAFLLSYGAILGILLVKDVSASFAVQLFLFPMLLWFYFEIPLYAMFLNLLVVPLMAPVLCLGIFGSMTSLFWAPFGKLMFRLCDWLLTFFALMGETSMKLPASRLVFGRPSVWELALYYVLLLWGLWWLRRKKRGRSLRILCVVGFLLFSCVLFWKPPNGKLQIAMLDVGQGDCIFVRGPKGESYLIDGGSSDVKEVGKYRIEPFLKSKGVGSLEYVFVSHGDGDHCNGIAELLTRQRFGVKIQRLVLPANYGESEELLRLARLAQAQSVAVLQMQAGECVTAGELRLSCLQPERTAGLSDNEGSMVLELSFRNFQMLFTGDVEGKGEALLCENGELGAYDVLKVAHHGSKNASSESFLGRVRPKIAWISAGQDNVYGHPHKECLLRLQKVGSKIYQTANFGAIQLETDGDFIDILPSCL
ncbi:MAG: DNA internalization-related competence protein ComEC/Rec2 [Faecalimonas sp.]|nr:DNA internalization-related competence protein ComEC/Rec2 [Faecalimonas sp.]